MFRIDDEDAPKPKPEMLPPSALEVLKRHRATLAPDLGAVVEAAFRLGYHMGRAEGVALAHNTGKVSKEASHSPERAKP